MVTAYYTTATTARCAPPARVLEFDRLVRTPLSPCLSYDYRPNRHVAAHIPTPAPIAATPCDRVYHHNGSNSPAHHCAKPPAPNRPCFCLLVLAYNCIRRAHGLDRAAPKDTPCLLYNDLSVIGNVVPTPLRIMSASLDALSAVICRFGQLPRNSAPLPLLLQLSKRPRSCPPTLSP